MKHIVKHILYWKGHRFIGLPIRWYLGYVFIIACIHKIADPGAFALDVATYDILPLSLINLMALTLPWIELLTGVMLVVGYETKAAALVISGMMVMFLVALLMALAAGLDMSCGCFASSAASGEDTISYETVIRDTVWLLLGLYVTVFDNDPLGVDGLISRKRSVLNA